MHNMLMDLVCDVSKELNKAKSYLLNLKAVDFSIKYIIEQQEELYKKYNKKIKNIKYYN